MDAAKRKALQSAGWKIGDAADFLALNDEERQLLDARVELALARELKGTGVVFEEHDSRSL